MKKQYFSNNNCVEKYMEIESSLSHMGDVICNNTKKYKLDEYNQKILKESMRYINKIFKEEEIKYKKRLFLLAF